MLFLDDARILAHSDPASLVEALRVAFAGDGDYPARAHLDLPGDDHAKLLLMPAWRGRDAIGVKVITVVPSNAGRNHPTVDGVYLLLDGLTGAPRAVLSAPALTVLRTAAVSGLAASLQARADAKSLLMVGTGALAPHLIRAHLAVRPIQRVMIWGRDADKATALAAALSGLPSAIEVVRDLAEATGRADIISCATLSTAPLIEGARVRPGTHVDLVGSFTPAMREADVELFRRGRLLVDTGNALLESGDLLQPQAEGAIGDSAPDLRSVLRDGRPFRRDEDEITIFKAVGTGLADLATAEWIVGPAGA